MKHLSICLLALTAALPLHAQTVVREWKPADIAKWSPSYVKDLRVENGALLFETQPGDAMLISPAFDGFAATPWQRIELEMKTDVAGGGMFFWTKTLQTKYGGFSPDKLTNFNLMAGDWQTYRIEPFWQAEKKIIKLRLDFPHEGNGHYAIRAIRVIEEPPSAQVSLPARDVELVAKGEWRARVSLDTEEGAFIAVRMAASAGEAGVVTFASDAVNGLHRVNFPLHADGRMHTYNVDVGANTHWRGKIVELRLQTPARKGAKTVVESIAFGSEPQGPPDLEVTWLGLHDPFTRAGRPARLEARVVNRGGEPARDLKPTLKLTGAKLIKEEVLPAKIEFGVPETLAWTVQADRPCKVKATLTLEGTPPKSATLDFLSAPKLPKAAYVPEPKPAKSDYQVGAYYFPGWNTASRWAPLKSFPERQPLLGWYREGDPAVADWQIKWAVEHGVNFFLYDWYWDRGVRHLEHGLHDALFKARYQDLIKFCLLYANHNPHGSHSPEDWEKITRFWIENYFKQPNYVTVEGKPMVVIFSSQNPARDMGAERVKPTFDRMRQMCRDAGLGGLYLVACINSGTNLLAKMKDYGYDAVSAYNWPHLNMTPEENRAKRAPFATAIAGFPPVWSDIASANVLKLIPPVCGGWDSRPWHGETALARTNRTPELFKKHLLDCKKFLDTREQAPKLKMLFVEAWNEWGEGSYIEPHREFGFGYLEAIRQVFAPKSPKPKLMVPADVGLGPYDIPDEPLATAWNFATATNALSWSGNVENLRIENGALRFTTRGRDPILTSPRLCAAAREFPFIVFRIKANRDIACQLFWSTSSSPQSEANSAHFTAKASGEFQEVKVRLAANPRWRGIITSLRFDPGSFDGVEVAVESVRLSAQ